MRSNIITENSLKRERLLKISRENKEREWFSDFVSYVIRYYMCVMRVRMRVRRGRRMCACVYAHTGEGDRPTEIKSTSGRALGETKVRVSVAAGKERRRRTRGRVTPECPRFLLSVPSLLSLARSLDLARPHASLTELSLSTSGPSLSPFPSCSVSPSLSLSLSLFRRTTPRLWGTLSLFFLYFLCPPLVQMARTISGRVVPYGILLERRVFLSIGTRENLSKLLAIAGLLETKINIDKNK